MMVIAVTTMKRAVKGFVVRRVRPAVKVIAVRMGAVNMK